MAYLAATKIITKGLSCTPACTSLITTHFSLSCGELPPPVESKNAGGGPYPGHAWNKFWPGEIQNFYRPVEPPFYVPRHREKDYFIKRKIVTTKIEFGQYRMEKTYGVSEGQARFIVNIINLANTTKQRMSIAVSNIKRITTTATITIKNLFVRRHK